MTSDSHQHGAGRWQGGRPHHDWQSSTYVQEWIDGDVTKDAERLPVLRRMLSLPGFASDAHLSVIDIGAGYGIVSRLVLETFPNAHVTLQDFSAPMLEQSKNRLAEFAGRMSFVLADLTDPAWTAKSGGPYDLAVSAIAIHNLGDAEKIAAVYAGVRRLLKPGGAFLDADYVFAGGRDGHLQWLKDGGFERIQAEMENERLAIMAAYAPV
jgi:ubiquinone/menaquinone biosynthesis C-methylase UbiE